jgi:hypothetical protein
MVQPGPPCYAPGMMTRRAFLVTVAALTAALQTLVLAQSPVTGHWALTVDSPQGTTQATLTLAVDGQALKGSISSDMGETPISGGTVAGTQVKFQFDYAGPSGPITIISTATVSGDEIRGEMDYGQGTAPFTGKRADK